MPVQRGVRILAYHAIRDVSDDPILSPFSVPPSLFSEHLECLSRDSYEFLSPASFVEIVQGERAVPRRGVLLTFDDCYEDLLDVAVPLLEARGIPAAAFVVTRRVGRMNEWDMEKGAAALPLLDVAGLSAVAARGVELGSHSRTHPLLTRVSDAALSDEITGSFSDFDDLGLQRPRFFAYPYGGHDERVRSFVESSGLSVAFTSEAGIVTVDTDPHRVPRLTIRRSDVGWRFRAKVASGGRAESSVVVSAARAARDLSSAVVKARLRSTSGPTA